MYDLAFVRLPDTVETRTRIRLQANVRRWTQRTNIVVTSSEFSKSELVACLEVPESRVAVVPLGVDGTVFKPQSHDEVDAVLRRLDVPRDSVFYLGNIEPRKNLARLVRSYGRLDGALQRAHPLVLAGGSSWNATEIEATIAAAQKRGEPVVRLRTRIDDADLPALLSGAAMVAHPALYEGFGLVPLQAMACGTPVLVGDRSAMPEVVGDAGAYVDPEDEDAITAQMTRVLTDTTFRSQLVAAGRTRAAAFTWEQTVTSLLSAVNSIMH
jgi:glycosyltransferase involved in cell wall biosynthesis